MSLTIRCDIVIEEFATDKCTIRRRIVLKDSQLAAVRDDIRQILLRVTPLGSSRSSKMVIKSFGYPVIDLDLHKRFIGQGKASISLPVHSVRLMLSNCPPDKLRLFLATLRLKVKAIQTTLFKKPIIPDAPPTSLSLLEELSPLRLPPSCSAVHGMILPPNVSKILPDQLLSPSSRSSQQVLTGPLQVSTPVRQSKSSKPRYRSFSRALHQISSAQCHADLQMKVIDLVNQGRNIFCTGGAGTGKSHLIRRVIGLLPPDRTAITASTGTAANLIGGITVHAFSGVGDLLSMEIGGSVEDNKAWLSALRTRLCGSPSIVAHWKKIRHLIIDEISMLSAEVFTRLEQLAQETRCPSDPDNIRLQNPFGGIQVILFGDFFQLPPVKKNGQAEFAFESPCWKRCRLATVELQHSWRQSDDPDLARLLTAAREGKCPEWMQQLLKSRCVPNREPPENESSLVPTRLCTHRSDADAWNLRMLNALQGDGKVFRAQDSGSKHSRLLDMICPAPAALHLKIGAQVMLLRNIDTSRGLVNGARGVVERLCSDGGALPQIRFFVQKLGNPSGTSCDVLYTVQREKWSLRQGDTGDIQAYRRQIPLSLAWAVSIHKSQGITLDSAELALSKVFECGQAYVALSRCRTLSGLRLLDWRPDVIQANPKVVQFYKVLRQNQEAMRRGEEPSDDEVDFQQSSPIKRAR